MVIKVHCAVLAVVNTILFLKHRITMSIHDRITTYEGYLMVYNYNFPREYITGFLVRKYEKNDFVLHSF